jgi:hypothetical protein
MNDVLTTRVWSDIDELDLAWQWGWTHEDCGRECGGFDSATLARDSLDRHIELCRAGDPL